MIILIQNERHFNKHVCSNQNILCNVCFMSMIKALANALYEIFNNIISLHLIVHSRSPSIGINIIKFLLIFALNNYIHIAKPFAST